MIQASKEINKDYIEIDTIVYDLYDEDLYFEFPTKPMCIKYIKDKYPNQFCDKFLIDKLNYETHIDKLLEYPESERLKSNEILVYGAELQWELLIDDIVIKELK